MRWLFVVVCFLTFYYFSAFAEPGTKRSHNRQGYQTGTSSGVETEGEARAQRQVQLQDNGSQTSVQEQYDREHRYGIRSPDQGTQSGSFRNNSEAGRTYYHHGENQTRSKIQAYETGRLGHLNAIDALLTRAEKAKALVLHNATHSKEERREFFQELERIDFETGEIGINIGSRAFARNNPDRPHNLDAAEESIFNTQWTLSPHRYEGWIQKELLRDIDWKIAHLSELQRSLATPFAKSKAVENRDLIKESQDSLRRTEILLNLRRR